MTPKTLLFKERILKENPQILEELSIVGDLISYKLPILCRNDYGDLKVLPETLLSTYKSGNNLNIGNAVNKEEYWINRAKKRRKDSPFIDYSEATFTNVKTNIKLRCLIHNYTYYQRATHHTTGVQGCIYCNEGTIKYTKENIEKHDDFFSEREASLYILQFESEDELFYKVGMTNRKLEYRIQQFPPEYKVTLLMQVEYKLPKCYAYEQMLLETFSKYKYIPKIYFGGRGECLSENPLNYYYYYK